MPVKYPMRLGQRIAAIGASVLILAAIAAPAGAAEELPRLGASRDAVTVSGLSSGAYMAVQFQIAYSHLVRGAGVIAGGPYDCARGSISRALKNCMAAPPDAQPPTVAEQQARIAEAARAHEITTRPIWQLTVPGSSPGPMTRRSCHRWSTPSPASTRRRCQPARCAM